METMEKWLIELVFLVRSVLGITMILESSFGDT